MITMEMSDDIRKYDTKTIGPFTTRQVVSIGIGLAYSVPIAIVTNLDVGNKVLLVCLLALPAICCGYVTMDGAPFEVIACRFLYWFLLTPRKRKMKSKNKYRELYEQMETRAENQKLARMTKSQRKLYLKRKNNKTVVYSKKEVNKVYH